MLSGQHLRVLPVSSLYGRVYRRYLNMLKTVISFLPVWEGVSKPVKNGWRQIKFPPYMGGCIDIFDYVPPQKTVSSLYVVTHNLANFVSSLYGRVYHCQERFYGAIISFLPTI